jgi:signal transduction histidine kinase
MNPGKKREQLPHWPFILAALVVPVLVGYEIIHQSRTPTLGFSQTAPNSPIVARVMPGEAAGATGLQRGDVILTVNGTPFATQNKLRLWQTYTLEIERDGQHLTCTILTVPLAQANYLPLVSGVTVLLTYWVSGILLLWRRIHQQTTRLLFLFSQALAMGVMPLARPWPPSADWVTALVIVCFHVAAPLLLHYTITFPVVLGTPRQRHRVLSLFYVLALVTAAGELTRAILGIQSIPFYLYGNVVFAIAITVQIYTYVHHATPEHRHRLRIVLLGTLLTVVPPNLFYFMPRIAGASQWMPEWLTALFLILAPVGYFYAVARHNLFGIDQLLNRAVVYLFLSLGVLALYVGPFLLLYRFLPHDPLAQILIVVGLSLVIGLGFDWTRTRVQRLVDRLFYGGWYDYAGVVETVSDALTRSLGRDQLTDVLTRQVPEMMQLHQGQLWIGEPDEAPQQPALPLQAEFQLLYRDQVRGMWTVGPRRDGDPWSAADRRILQTLAHQAEIALSNVLLVEALRHQLEELRTSRETLAQAQHQLLGSREEERARLARDLHDGPIQILVGLNMQLGLLLASLGDEHILPDESLTTMRAEVRTLLSELRQACAELRPPMLDTLGLGAAIRALAQDWFAQSDIPVALDLSPDATLRSLPDDVTVNLYRVAQEALSNTVRINRRFRAT